MYLFFAFYFNVIASKSHTKNYSENGREKWTKKQQLYNSKQIIIILAAVPQYLLGRGDLVVNTSNSGSRGRGYEPHSGRRVVSLSKIYLPPKSTGNTQEAVAPSQRDWKNYLPGC